MQGILQSAHSWGLHPQTPVELWFRDSLSHNFAIIQKTILQLSASHVYSKQQPLIGSFLDLFCIQDGEAESINRRCKEIP